MKYWPLIKSKFETLKNAIVAWWRNIIANTRKILRLNVLITGLATIVIAIATCFNSCISGKLARLQEINTKNNKVALEIEFRPYLSLELLKINGAHIYYPEGNMLNLPIHSVNVGKVPALNVEAKYISPIQTQDFETEDKTSDIPSGVIRYYTPAVNIGDPSQYGPNNKLMIKLITAYSGNPEVSDERYNTELRLKFKKLIKGNEIGFELERSDSYVY